MSAPILSFPPPPHPNSHPLLHRWARRIVDRGLATPAIFLLEAHKPLGGLAGQFAVAFQPFLEPFARLNVREIATLSRDPAAVERLIGLIESMQGRHPDELASRRDRLRRAVERLRRRQARRRAAKRRPRLP